MSVQTSIQSYGSRVGGAFKGIGFGGILVVIGVVALFWNEGRTIKETRKLNEGAKVVVSVASDSVDASNEGKLIHISGDVVTEGTVSDNDFKISLNALKLTRKVEMYQWEEETETETTRLSGGREETRTTTSYKKVWSEDLIDSTQFQDSGYDNPTVMPYQGEVFTVDLATLGAFKLSEDQIAELSPEISLDPNKLDMPKSNEGAAEGAETNASQPADAAQPANAPAEEVKATEEAPSSSGAYVHATTSDAFTQDFSVSSDLSVGNTETKANLSISTGDSAKPAENPNNLTVTNERPVVESTPLGPPLQPYGNGYYAGTPNNPQIGDVRITFSYVKTPCPTSFVGQQHGDGLIEYETKNGPLFLQSEGIKSAETMFDDAYKANKTMAWIIRLVGFFAILIGFKTIFQPIEIIADFVPFARNIVGIGTGILAWSLTIFLALGTIAVGWIYYRPWLGIPLLVVAVGALIYPFVRGKKKSDNASSGAASPIQ